MAGKALALSERYAQRADLPLAAMGGVISMHISHGELLQRAGRMAAAEQALLAGLGELQHFLESGFEAFGSMRGAARFIAAIEQREGALNAALSGAGGLDGGVLDQLPPVA